MTDPVTYKGDDASIWLSGTAHSSFALSDFTITISKGVAEQELLGETGNYFLAGSQSVEGSFTGCRLTTSGLGVLLSAMINGDPIKVSGNAGANSLHFYIKSAQVTSFDFSIGDADTITEGSMDWTALYPYKISSVELLGGGGTKIKDFA